MKKNILKRSVSALLLICVLVPFFIITKFLNNDVGKAIGLIFYVLFASIATFEIISWNGLSIFFNILLVLFSLLIWFLPNFNFWDSSSSLQLKEIILKATWDNFPNSILLGALIIILITAIFFFISKQKSLIKFLITTLVLIYIPLFFKYLFIYNIQNLYLFGCIFLIPIIVDTSAYFGGMLLGKKIIKKPFSPKISPKKTWEGAIISYLLGMLFVYLLMYLPHNNQTFKIFTKVWQLIVGMILLPIVSILGDLLFSLFKRKLKIKDYSNLIPGHGGIMDRFDSTSLVAIAVTLILAI